MEYRVFPCGESAITFELGASIDPESNAMILLLRERILSDPFPGMREVVSGYSSLTLIFDCSAIVRQANAKESVHQLLEKYILRHYTSLNSNRVAEGTLHTIPVCYHPTLGVDLYPLARHLDLTPEELVSLHHAQEYRIYMIGFLPGFPYLGFLPDQLYTLRKNSPVQVRAGSVAIAGRQTGIYPFHSPGGWNVIGRTPLILFQPDREPPVIWKAGDRVRFVPIDIEEFNENQHHS